MRGMQSVQPQYPARVAQPWASVFQSVYNPGDSDGLRDLLGNNHLTAGTGTGELTRAVDMRGRRAFKGTNGANGYARKNSAIAALAYPVVMVSVSSYATTASKSCTSFSIAGASIGSPNSKFTHTGHTGSNNAFCYEFNGGRATGMTRIIGTAYGSTTLNIPRCTVTISRSATEHYMWVDGVEFTSSANAGTIDDTPHNVGLGAMATATSVITYPIEGNVALAAFGYGVDPGNAALRALSLNPWQMFAVRAKRRAVSGAPVVSLGGDALLAGITASGTISSGASTLSGDAVLAGITADGGLGLAPGVITSPVFKNWSGTLLTGLTIPKVAILKVSDMSTVLTLTDQTTNGSGVLSISNAALVPATQYLLVTCNADGTAFGCEPVTAA